MVVPFHCTDYAELRVLALDAMQRAAKQGLESVGTKPEHEPVPQREDHSLGGLHRVIGRITRLFGSKRVLGKRPLHQRLAAHAISGR